MRFKIIINLKIINYLMKNIIIICVIDIKILNSILNKLQTHNITNLIIINNQQIKIIYKIYKNVRFKHKTILKRIILPQLIMILKRNNNLLNKMIKQICMSHFVVQQFLNVKDVKWQQNQIQHNQLVIIVITIHAQKNT